MAWKQILGQAHAIGLLRSAIASGRLPNAYLFCGPDGVGKDAVALELAKVLNCQSGRDEACDDCPSCRSASRLQHPDIRLVFPLPVGKGEESGDSPVEKLSASEIGIVHEELRSKAGNPYHDIVIPRATVIKVNSIREVRRTAALSTSGTGRRVFVISDAECMNDEAANALLKTLEEPHADCLFILTTSQPDRLLPTIGSRCQKIVFERIPEETIAQALASREGVSGTDAAMSAMLAQGSYARALRSLNAPLKDQRDEAVEFLREVLSRSRLELVMHIDRFSRGKEREDVEHFLLLMQGWIRDAMNVRQGRSSVVNRDDMEALTKFASRYVSTDFAGVFGSFDRAVSLLSRNVYIPLILTALAVQLRRAIR